jgi:hypothetical protein
MVLIGNNKVLTIEQFHKNRCIEKNEMRDILVRMKFEREAEEKEARMREYLNYVDRSLEQERKEREANPYVPPPAPIFRSLGKK